MQSHSTEEIKQWSKRDVAQYLRMVFPNQLEEGDIMKIISNNINGRVFLKMNQDSLMSLGMTYGSAATIAEHVEQLKGMRNFRCRSMI